LRNKGLFKGNKNYLRLILYDLNLLSWFLSSLSSGIMVIEHDTGK